MKSTILLLLMVLTFPPLTAQKSPYEHLKTQLPPEDLKSDIDTWFDWLHATHPDLSYTVKDIDRLYQSVAQIRDSIIHPMEILEFWKRISPLNSQLSDGHTFVGYINSTIVEDYILNGGNLFPFEVIFNKDDLVIHSLIDGKPSEYMGHQIVKINNIPIETITSSLLSRINGDSEEHRKAILQTKFSIFYMLMYGEQQKFDIEVLYDKKTQVISINGICGLPKLYREETFEDNFDLKILDHENAVLTVNSFWWDDPERYYSFMDTSFSALQSHGISHLIIDIRKNGGGDDQFWMKGILRYIADKPYRWGSNYKKKIIAKFRDPGEVIGSIKEGEIDTLIPVDTTATNTFKGKVSILIGPYTYSSAILFANTVQDYTFGQLVGEPTGGKSGQTGSIQFFKMPNTGLTAVSPRFYLERPNGGKTTEPVTPDIIIDYNKLSPDELIAFLLNQH
ncbi:S41 family peptidase [Muricauda sp. 334s03]|uniref:S41 family peptidase n=1 Tax=Flagellimonas yonaguniensis TaxID=3031325 RepID=A0ABT5XWR0_9FLAO|nr:S41 family peptidase [[Muricauda] yonaguniensis]MDF0715625.1 S41 family peptidase [[Muricauda] yonaguniensis]